MANKMYRKLYRLFNHDVIRDEEGGWSSNDRVQLGIISVEMPVTDKQIIRALKDEEFIRPRIKSSSIEIDGEPDYSLYVNSVRKKDGGFMPLFDLEAVEAEIKVEGQLDADLDVWIEADTPIRWERVVISYKAKNRDEALEIVESLKAVYGELPVSMHIG